MEFRKMVMITLYAKQKKTQKYRTDFWTLWENARVGCFQRTAYEFLMTGPDPAETFGENR